MGSYVATVAGWDSRLKPLPQISAKPRYFCRPEKNRWITFTENASKHYQTVGAALAANRDDLHTHLFIQQITVSLTQNILLYLRHRIAWQFINKNNIFRNLEIRQRFLTRVDYPRISYLAA